jgi:hypothetical protein
MEINLCPAKDQSNPRVEEIASLLAVDGRIYTIPRGSGESLTRSGRRIALGAQELKERKN